MIFNKHSDLAGKHAFLSASKYHWLGYDDEKLAETFDNHMTAARGTRLHALAAELIRLGVTLPDNSKTLNAYVNDCIGFGMEPEVTLFYSFNAFGTADAISFDGPERLLRIFDLKNGMTKANFTQLMVYAAFFCLEYNVGPAVIDFDLRIYQHDQIYYWDGGSEDIMEVRQRVIDADKLVESMKGV